MKNILITLILIASLISCKKEEMPAIESAATLSPVYEAELAKLNGAVVAKDALYAGGAFADYKNPAGDYVEWTINKTVAGNATLNFRYANGSKLNRPLKITVNTVVVAATQAFIPTGSWTSFGNSLLTTALVAGTNKIRLTAIGSSGANMDNLTWIEATDITQPDHIIFVWMENHSYTQVIGSSNAPYINSLRAKGTTFSNFYALGHPSYPEYIRFFSGSAQNIYENVCITNAPYSTPNLYTELKKVGKTFAWYSEGLPAQGSRICESGEYTVHHNPTTIFNNVPTTANKTWAQFPTDFTKLENVVCITPNEIHDMHDGSISNGDTWIKNNLSKLVEWCRTNNSIFVFYMDEDNDLEGNHIPVIAVGQHVKANYVLGTHYDHYNWTKTISSLFGASTTWTANIARRSIITGCWF